MARTLRISHSFVKFSSKNISECKRKGKQLPLFDVMKRLVVEINTLMISRVILMRIWALWLHCNLNLKQTYLSLKTLSKTARLKRFFILILSKA